MNKEILVKTLVGKGKIQKLYETKIKVDRLISKTLGCWVINFSYEIENKNNQLFLKGSFDIQLWYAYENDQKSDVYHQKVDFENEVNINYRSDKVENEEVFTKIYVNKYPSCNSMYVNEENEVELEVEYVVFIEIFQELPLVINALDNNLEDIPLEEEITMNVNENYLIDKK